MIATIATIGLVIVVSPYFFMAFAPEEPETEHEEPLSDSRILLDYPISEIFIMDDDIIITYSNPLVNN
jgi:hypothetical protein